MGQDDIAKRLASEYMLHRAEQLRKEAEDGHQPGVCSYHASHAETECMVVLALHALLHGQKSVRDMILSGLPLWGPVCLIVASAWAGIAYGVARAIGFGP